MTFIKDYHTDDGKREFVGLRLIEYLPSGKLGEHRITVAMNLLQRAGAVADGPIAGGTSCS
jgi:hypothetical protein